MKYHRTAHIFHYSPSLEKCPNKQQLNCIKAINITHIVLALAWWGTGLGLNDTTVNVKFVC